MAEIFIYTALIDSVTEEQLACAMEKLPQWRRDYIKKKGFAGKTESTFSYLLLQKIVLERFGLIDTDRFTYEKFGKPYFSHINVFFSMSHCKTAVAAAVSETEVGVDIMDNRLINENIASRICSKRELEKFNEAGDGQRFLRELWCKKESLVKKSGEGFNKGFAAADTENYKFFLFSADKYTVSLAVEPFDTVIMNEISFLSL